MESPNSPDDPPRTPLVRGAWHRIARSLRSGAGPWRTRVATLGGAVVVGVVALAFARTADACGAWFAGFVSAHPVWPLVMTPLGFAFIAWLTRRFAPDAVGSGIPQVIAATRRVDEAMSSLVSLRTVIAKLFLTAGTLLVGASTGREGPTVQVAASIMAHANRLLRVPVTSAVYIAGGAAGVAAAFNTPLAGVAFAIEELAASYEQRVTMLVMTAVLISGLTSLALAGDYVYFGAMREVLGASQAIVASIVCGVVGGCAGGAFSRAMLAAGRTRRRPMPWLRAHPTVTALICGVVVAGVGVATQLTWGTGYGVARDLIGGGDAPWWFGLAKLATTLATAVAGLPGGIFAPSLSVGAGIGHLVRPLLDGYPPGAVVLLGMVAYFTGVVRAPLTAVIIIAETTASRGLMMPLLASALIADFCAHGVCKERLYHGLSKRFERAPA